MNETSETKQIHLNPEISKWRDEQLVNQELFEDIRERGQLQSLVARRLKNGELELIAGHRRLLAMQALGKNLEDMDIKVLDNVSNVDAVLMAISENRHRQDLKPIEEARAFRTLRKYRLSLKKIAEKVNRSESYVRSRLNLLEMPEQVQGMIQSGDVEISYAEPLKKLKDDPEAQIQLAKKVKNSGPYSYGGIKTVEQMEEAIQEFKEKRKHKEDLVKQYGSCPKCGSKLISDQRYFDKEKLSCDECDHEWHRETKDPWEYYELIERARRLGLDLELKGPNDAKLSPAEITKIIEERTEAVTKVEKPNPSFRSNYTPAEMLVPLIQDNVMSATIDGEEITLKLIEDSTLNFSVVKKDYVAGEKSRVTVKEGWRGEETDKLAYRKPRVERYLKSLKLQTLSD